MRWAAFIALAFSLAGASGAAAQPLASKKALTDAAFAPKSSAVAVDPSARFVEREAYAVGQGPLAWQGSEVRLSGDRKSRVDSLRVTVGGTLLTPGGLPLNLERGEFRADSVDVTLVRKWPKAVSFQSDGLAFDVEPHAGVGVGSKGGQAEGGAMLTVSKKTRGEQAVEKLKDLGVQDGAAYGDAGRWYLFAAASGRAVGLNVMKNEQGWDRAGWSTDPTGALVGDAQVGVGWRKGDMQSSFGVIHREVKGQHMIFGQTTRNDTVAAFTFSLRPQR